MSSIVAAPMHPVKTWNMGASSVEAQWSQKAQIGQTLGGKPELCAAEDE